MGSPGARCGGNGDRCRLRTFRRPGLSEQQRHVQTSRPLLLREQDRRQTSDVRDHLRRCERAVDGDAVVAMGVDHRCRYDAVRDEPLHPELRGLEDVLLPLEPRSAVCARTHESARLVVLETRRHVPPRRKDQDLRLFVGGRSRLPDLRCAPSRGQLSSGAILNTGWSGAIRRNASSGDVAVTPPKKTPTSAFHRFR